MKILSTLVFIIALATRGASQGPNQISLKDTVGWMTSFLGQHGMSMANGKLADTTKISSSEGCTISITHLSTWATAKEFKTRSESVNLRDFDPTNIRFRGMSGDGGAYEVTIERTDSLPKTEVAVERGDGTKETLKFAQISFVMDSKENAGRFGAALHHAIKLCGGTTAPF